MPFAQGLTIEQGSTDCVSEMGKRTELSSKQQQAGLSHTCRPASNSKPKQQANFCALASLKQGPSFKGKLHG